MPTSSFNLSDLDGTNGFVINGLNPGDRFGASVSGAGDINGDGIADLIIGAPSADANGSNSGSTYIVFGGTTLGLDGSFDLSTLDGSNGFVINGITGNQRLGNSVSDAGDINGDGFDDLIIGAPSSYYGVGNEFSAVFFGNADIGSSGSFDLTTLDGSNGLLLDNFPGYAVNNAGDINGDGFDDLIMGGRSYIEGGYSYVIFGGPDVGTNGPLNRNLNGRNGFRINYYDVDLNIDRGATRSVSGAGDINGDGIDDLIISTSSFAGVWSSGGPGESFVIFGSTDVGGDGNLNVSSLDGSNGFVIQKKEQSGYFGWSAGSAGDINGDGIADLIIGDPGGDIVDSAENPYFGKSYIVFGGADIATTGSDLSLLDGSNGFVINSTIPFDKSGYSVSNGGDINGDGIDDLIIGAPGAYRNNDTAGSTYVVFGGAGIGAGGSFDLSTLDGNNGFVIDGIVVGDRLGWSVSGAGDVNADGIDDVIIGAPFADGNGVRSGSSYVLFGSPVSVAEATSGNDTLLGTNAGDVIRGGMGDDLINGRNGNDILLGNQGNDTLIGGNGDDLLFGGWGKDVLTGGAGSDRFILSQNSGTDTITDFESGIDSLVLLGNLTFEQITITQSNNDTLLSFGSNNQVIANLTGISANTLSAADFINL